MKAQLILENGIRFTGNMFGACRDIVGEIVFTTNMTGYQETVTDPSYCGQIVVMTFPLIGNYGINLDDGESEHPKLRALVVREKCGFPSNFRNEMNLDDYLMEEDIVGLEGIDTRALTRIIREHGCMTAVIMRGEPSDADVCALMSALDNSNVILECTSGEIYTVNPNGSPNVALIDMGAKSGIVRELKQRGAKITVYPANIPASVIRNANPDLVFISNGPGNPEDAPGTVDTIRSLIGEFPICGICMGHQIIGLSLGARIAKLKFGHHGGNHPVKDLITGTCYITSQNHNYIVSDLPEDVENMFVNVNDGTCEGIMHKSLPIMSVQFHPEAAPGPLDSGWLFDRFLKLAEKEGK